MTKEELTNKLVRLGNMMHEAKEIIEEIGNDVNGRVNVDCPDMKIAELLPHSTVMHRFVNAANRVGVKRLGDLLMYTPEEVMQWRNVGRKCVADVKKAIKERFGVDWE